MPFNSGIASIHTREASPVTIQSQMDLHEQRIKQIWRHQLDTFDDYKFQITRE